MMKKMMSMMLALFMLINSFVINPAYAQETEKEISVWYFNQETEMMEIADKVELFSGGEMYLSAFVRDDMTGDLQWQIEASKDFWVDIQGETNEDLRVSYGMVRNLLREDSVRIRCVVNSDSVYYSDPVTVTITTVNNQLSLNTYAFAEEQIAPEPLPAPVAVSNDSDETEQIDEEISLMDYESVSLLADDIIDTDKTYYSVLIEYVYADNSKFKGERVAKSYIAEVEKGYTFKSEEVVVSPNCVGYSPNINKVTLSELGAINDNVHITVLYSPAEVTYTVRHYHQNIDNDEYTWVDTTMVSGITENKTSDNAAQTYVGFTALAHYKEEIAADSSTLIDIYYDRNYYMMSFELDGGHGVNPIYARYETPIDIGEPTKYGYSFVEWVDNNDNPVAIPLTMPAKNETFYALWGSKQNTKYRVTYWAVDDENNKTLLGSHIEYAESGETVNGLDNLGTANGYICGEETTHIHVNECFSCNTIDHNHTLDCFSSFTLEPNNPENGTNAINALGAEDGYIYVIYNPTSGTYWPKLRLGGQYYVVNGTQGGTNESSYSAIVNGNVISSLTGTYGTETLTVYKYQARTDCLNFQHTHTNSCNQICEEHTHNADCKLDTKYLEFLEADQNVVVNGDGSSVVNVYYQYKKYTLRFYYAASTGSGNNTVYKIVGGTTYYFGSWGTNTSNDEILLQNQYFDYSGQWGQVDELPTLNDRGNQRNYDKGSVTYTRNKQDVTYYYISFSARYGENIADKWPCGVFNSVTRLDKNNTNGWSGNEAFVSAWNGEHHVEYSKNSNQTIKGVYEKLDENLLFASDYTDESTVSYLCFWENGANINWSVPELYRYNIYVSAYSGQDLTDETTITRNGVTYYLFDTYDTCDNSEVDEQTQVALNGYEAITFNSPRNNEYKVSTNKKFEYKELIKTFDESLKGEEGYYDGNLYSKGYEVFFYYNTKTHKLSFWNHDDYLTDDTGSLVAYNEPLKKYFEGIGSDDGANDLIEKPEYYPKSLEEGAFTFEGWYTSDGFEPETRVDYDTIMMQDENLMVYAHWVPVIRQVTIHFTEDSSAEDTVSVSNGSLVPDLSHPDESELKHPMDSTATFIGWFYRDKHGVEQAFDFENTPVIQDIAVYAKWRSNQMKEVQISYFVEDENGNRTQIADTETYMLRVGQTRTFEAKTGISIYESYRGKTFPLNVTHSITPTVDDMASSEPIEYTFVYKKFGNVPYQVEFYVKEDGTERPAFIVVDGKAQFIDSDTFAGWSDEVKNEFINSNKSVGKGDSLEEGGKYIEQHWENDKSIVVEFYLPDEENLSDPNWRLPEEYLPNAVKTQKVIVPGSENAEENIAANIIKFVYEVQEPDNPVYEAKYLVQHYLQSTSDKNVFELRSFVNKTGYTGDTVSAVPASFLGYAFNAGETNARKQDGTVLNSDNTLSGTVLSDNSLELNFYYTVKSYPYQVMYLEEGSNRVLADTKLTDSSGNQLRGDYGTEVTENAIEIEGYKVVGEATKKLEINMEADENVANVNTIVFYYAIKSSELVLIKEVKLDEEQANQEGIADIPDWVNDQPFVFTVRKPDGYPKSYYYYTLVDQNGVSTENRAEANNTTLSVEMKNGESITIHDLPPAKYYVSESYVPGFRISVDGWMKAEYEADLSVDGTVGKLDFLNTFPFYTGDLVLKKNVTKIDSLDPNATEPFKVRVVISPHDDSREVDRIITFEDSEGNSCTDYNGNSSYTIPKLTGENDQTEFVIEVLVPVDGEIKLKDVPVGSFVATEEPKGTVGYIYDFFKVKYNKAVHQDDEETGTNHLVSGTIHGGHPTAVTFTNTYKKGSLVINKTVNQEYENNSWDQDTFKFSITGKTELPDGDYYILVDGVSEIAKVVSGNVVLEKTIAVERTDDSETSWSNQLSIENLPAGYYTISETAGKGNDKYTSGYVSVPDTGLVNNTDVPAVFNFTNTYKRTTGSIQVGKKIMIVSTGAIIDVNQEFTFTVSLKDGLLADSYSCTVYSTNGSNDKKNHTVVADSIDSISVIDGILTFNLKHEQYIVIEGLPVGEYIVTELGVEGYKSSFSDVVHDTNNTMDPATIKTGMLTELTCQNAFPVYYARLIVEKDVVTPLTNSAVDQAPTDDMFKYELKVWGYSDKVNLANGFDAEFYDLNNDPILDRECVLVSASGDTPYDVITFVLKDGEYVYLNLPNCKYTINETELISEKHSGDSLEDHYDVTYKLDGIETLENQEHTLATGHDSTIVVTNTYKQHTADLVISTKSKDDSQIYIFTLTSTEDDIDFSMQVSVKGTGSVTIKDVPFGNYSIVESDELSWRENFVSSKVASILKAETVSVEFDFENVDRKNWINHISSIIKNRRGND